MESHRENMNRLYVANRNQSVRAISRVYQQISQRILPAGVTILYQPGDRCFTLQTGRGDILITDPHDMNFGTSRFPAEDGMVRMSCSFDAHSFYYTEIVAQDMHEFMDILQFHLELQAVQINRNVHVVRAPRHLSDHPYLPSARYAAENGWSLVFVS